MKQQAFVRTAGVSLMIGALLQLVLGTWQALYPVWPPSLAFSLRNGGIALSHALVLIGIIGLARSGAAGRSPLGRVGLGVAMVGGALFVPSELLIQFNEALGSNLDGMCAALMAIGLVITGIAVLRAKRWEGWHSITPLLTGLYVFLVIFPAFAITKAPNFLALAGWGIPSLLLGFALRTEASGSRQRVQSAGLAPVR